MTQHRDKHKNNTAIAREDSNVWAELVTNCCRNVRYIFHSPQISGQANVRGIFAITGVSSFVVGAYGFYKNDVKMTGIGVSGFVLSALAFWKVDKSDKAHEIEMARTKHPPRAETINKATATEMSLPQQVSDVDQPNVDLDWFDRINGAYGRPEFPEMIETILIGVPNGFDQASLMHLLSAISAYCFSRVKAKHLDNEMHGPNIQVVISAPSGAGKDKFRAMTDRIFSRFIERDKSKMEQKAQRGEEGNYPRLIVQSLGIGATSATLPETFYENDGVHAFVFLPEALSLVNDMKKDNGGIGLDTLRLAFDGGEGFQDKKMKGSFKGRYKIALNTTITGVPEDVKKLFSEDAVKGGNANRCAFLTIPRPGREVPAMTLPEGKEMEEIQDQLDQWQKKFAYYNDGNQDIPCAEYIIDLEYVCQALNSWINTQWDIGIENGDEIRQSVRTRMACIAFHAAIPLHMMWGEPDEDKPEIRDKVVQDVIYIANLCMEGYLNNVGSEGYKIKTVCTPEGSSGSTATSTSPKSPDDMTEEELVKKWSETGDYEYAYLLNTKYVDKRGTSRYGGGTLHKLYPLYAERTIQNKLAEMRKARQK